MKVLFRASMIGKLMTEPRSKSEGPLSQGAKTAIRDIAAQHILGVEFEASSREMEKGIECEPDSIGLLNRVRGLALTKNTERRDDGYLTGECDLYDAAGREGYDLKTAWSAATFPILADDIGGSQRALYEWQCRAYMALWDALGKAVNQPVVRLLGGEPRLVLHGGGNTSVKTRMADVTGHALDVLCVKGSGWDMGTIEPKGLPAVRLQPLRRLRSRLRASSQP